MTKSVSLPFVVAFEEVNKSVVVYLAGSAN